jgi:glycosyltransferase involved in cell wall biosynthesis
MQDLIKILGHIPKNDQISLVKFTLAIVQSTLFEGGPGGGAAYDAIALGIPVIASNIPVNLEINCGDVSFFTASNHNQLAVALQKRGTKLKARPSNEKLLEDGITRKRLCGEFILHIGSQAITDFNI